MKNRALSDLREIAMLRLIVLGPLVIGLNAVLVWTLEHTDIVAFITVLLVSAFLVFAVHRLIVYVLNPASSVDSKGHGTRQIGRAA
jgi:hypothetical protein